jgi:hypothetical protein
MFQETFIVQLPDLCLLSMYAFVHVCTILTLAEKHKSVHARFSSKQTHAFVHGDVPLHEHIRSCKVFLSSFIKGFQPSSLYNLDLDEFTLNPVIILPAST